MDVTVAENTGEAVVQGLCVIENTSLGDGAISLERPFGAVVQVVDGTISLERPFGAVGQVVDGAISLERPFGAVGQVSDGESGERPVLDKPPAGKRRRKTAVFDSALINIEQQPVSETVPVSLVSPMASPLSKTNPEGIGVRKNSLSKRRASAQLLQPLSIPNSTWQTRSKMETLNRSESIVIDESICEESRQLFSKFILQQLCQLGFNEAELVENMTTISALSASTTLASYPTLEHQFYQLALKFGATPQRYLLKKRANSIDLDTISSDELQAMLSALFADGAILTVERVLTLFYFSLELAALALLKSSSSTFMNVMDWAVKFVRESLSKWLSRLGGWKELLKTPLEPYVIGLCACAVAVFFVFGIHALNSDKVIL